MLQRTRENNANTLVAEEICDLALHQLEKPASRFIVESLQKILPNYWIRIIENHWMTISNTAMANRYAGQHPKPPHWVPTPRSCLRGILSLHTEMLVSPNATNEAA